jgi:hypothetical protein
MGRWDDRVGRRGGESPRLVIFSMENRRFPLLGPAPVGWQDACQGGAESRSKMTPWPSGNWRLVTASPRRSRRRTNWNSEADDRCCSSGRKEGKLAFGLAGSSWVDRACWKLPAPPARSSHSCHRLTAKVRGSGARAGPAWHSKDPLPPLDDTVTTAPPKELAVRMTRSCPFSACHVLKKISSVAGSHQHGEKGQGVPEPDLAGHPTHVGSGRARSGRGRVVSVSGSVQVQALCVVVVSLLFSGGPSFVVRSGRAFTCRGAGPCLRAVWSGVMRCWVPLQLACGSL